jgi:hypothetical protein
MSSQRSFHSEPRILLRGLTYVESPRWHEGRLWFAHWGTNEIIAVDFDGTSEVVAHGRGGLGWSIDWLPDGRLLVTGEGLRTWRGRDGRGAGVSGSASWRMARATASRSARLAPMASADSLSEWSVIDSGSAAGAASASAALRATAALRIAFVTRSQSHGPRRRRYPTVTPSSAFLRDLRAAWASGGEWERAKLRASVYDRIVVNGREVVAVELTDDANRHGLAWALPEQVVVALARPAGARRRQTTIVRVPVRGRAEWMASTRKRSAS